MHEMPLECLKDEDKKYLLELVKWRSVGNKAGHIEAG